MSDINKDGVQDDTQPQVVIDWFTNTPEGQKAVLTPLGGQVWLELNKASVQPTGSDYQVKVPAWLYDTATGSVTPKGREVVRRPGERQQRMVTPGAPQTATGSQLGNLVLRLAGEGNKTALRRLSKYLTGRTDLSLEQLSNVWDSTLKLVELTGLSMDKVIKSKDLDVFRVSGLAPAGPNVTRNVTLTDAPTARQKLQQMMSVALGRKPTDAEVKDYQKKLNAAERKNPTIVRSSGGTTTVTESGLDRDLFLRNYVLAKADWAQDLEGDIGGVQDRIDQGLADYGVSNVATKNMRIDLMRRYAKNEISEDALNAELRDLAARTYTAFAEELEKFPQKSLRDVAAPLITTYANMMEEDVQMVDLSKVLSKAVGPDGKPMSAFDFQKVVRKDPRYQFTGNAHQEAAAFGRSFAQSMGVNL